MKEKRTQLVFPLSTTLLVEGKTEGKNELRPLFFPLFSFLNWVTSRGVEAMIGAMLGALLTTLIVKVWCAVPPWPSLTVRLAACGKAKKGVQEDGKEDAARFPFPDLRGTMRRSDSLTPSRRASLCFAWRYHDERRYFAPSGPER